MKPKIRFEIKRKIVHVIFTFYPLLLIYFNVAKGMSILLSLIYLTLWLLSEFLRTSLNLNTPTAFLVKAVSRDLAGGRLKSTWKRIRVPYWILGLTIVMIFANRTSLLAATVTLTFGDALSGLLKSISNKNSKVLGLLSGIAISFLILYPITGNFLLALLAPAIGMLAELTSDYIDDNFSIPLLTAIVATIVQILI